YLHFDPETNRMAWLGYTFTFGSDEKSDDVNWIRYNEWTRVEGLLLPKLITWHNSEGRKVKEPKNPVNFDNISLEKTSKPDSFYSVPKNAKVVLKQG
ncbi:MAG: hypothetical protein HKN31_08235, partial [Pricia sp.]|nr:hypothetical protein [Pricia sp.]